MAKRIVEDLHENGTIRYRVETNDGFFGWFYKKFNIWYTDSFKDYESDMTFYAIFDTLNAARVFCGNILLHAMYVQIKYMTAILKKKNVVPKSLAPTQAI